MDTPLSEKSPAYQMGHARGRDEAELVELNDELKRQFLNGVQPDPPELEARSPLSGEWACQSIVEILGSDYTEEEVSDYEQGFITGWEECLLQRCSD